MVLQDGFEPPTLCSEDRCSNPLSYGCTPFILTCSISVSYIFTPIL